MIFFQKMVHIASYTTFIFTKMSHEKTTCIQLNEIFTETYQQLVRLV